MRVKRAEKPVSDEALVSLYDALIGLASTGEAIGDILEAAARSVRTGIAYINPDGDVLSAKSSPADFQEKMRFYPMQEICRLYDVEEIPEEDGRAGRLVFQDASVRERRLVPPVRLAVQVHFSARRARVRRRQQRVDDFLLGMLDNLRGDIAPNEIAAAFNAMGVHFAGGVQVVVGYIRRGEQPTNGEFGAGFFLRLDARFRTFSRDYISSIRDDLFVAAISPPSSSSLSALTSNLAEISTHVATRHYDGAIPPGVHLGFGNAKSDASEVAVCCREAAKAVQLALATGERRFISTWDDLGAFKLICRISEFDDAFAFCKDTLKSIAFPGLGKRDELFETLIALEKNNWNLREVARKTFYHHNTIKNRYHRIEEILGKNLSDPETRFDISFAIRILQSTSLDGSMEGDRP